MQIDADGQHDVADVPRFVEAARAEPAAVIPGRPVYDASAPKFARYGRYLTHVWVWIETLSFEIRDSMCGFRLYPLDLVCALIDRVALPERMDFDIEILVRLHWQHALFRSIPTRVTYATDGVSHFDMPVGQPAHQSHSRAVWSRGWCCVCPCCWRARRCRAVRRGRRSARGERADPPWWRTAERGSRFGMRILALSCRLFGLRVTGWWLYPVVAWFVLTGAAARAASRNYLTHLERAAPQAKTPRPGCCRLPAHAGVRAVRPRQAGRVVGRHQYRRCPLRRSTRLRSADRERRGALVIGGASRQPRMTRALATRGAHSKVTAVVYTGHARRVQQCAGVGEQQLLASSRRSRRLRTGDRDDDAGAHRRRRAAGDRRRPRARARSGGARPKPAFSALGIVRAGAVCTRACAGLPVYLFFCLKERHGHCLYFEPFAERIDLPRHERTQQIGAWAQRYAARLEHYCCKAPFQWFNFFDFWARPRGGPDGRT